MREVLTDPLWEDLGKCLRTGGVADVGWASLQDQAERDARERVEVLEAAEREHTEAAAAVADLEAVLAGAAEEPRTTLDAWTA
ncbi:hypothetical protein ACQE98_17540 [Ornithinimicrobium sp. W1679]|uniref:hypothetical protein n=1 Tax=Ornithinimicrobium sp. W1679 TaxID=3418770 RepID=UPI003CE7EDB0